MIWKPTRSLQGRLGVALQHLFGGNYRSVMLTESLTGGKSWIRG